ncbi:unnamed protein product [Rhizophagus irregularis]|uniref:Uncharacterized protein n=1 Tax=Rhizophagus irregularis TaxID=588596 RepID=A0A916E9F6_9GLOM|nr:unnamed protein product [Rhizophagus irregularis]
MSSVSYSNRQNTCINRDARGVKFSFVIYFGPERRKGTINILFRLYIIKLFLVKFDVNQDRKSRKCYYNC